MHVLLLGGTTEARRLAEMLCAPGAWAPGGGTGTSGGSAKESGSRGAGEGGGGVLRVTTSLAGRVAAPRMPPGEVRVGGFGGTEGMVRWLRTHRVDALIDATHPFARTISFHAAEAAATAHVPLLALRRPGWVPGAGDDWHTVGSLAAAADLLPALGRRVFLTTGRTGLGAFAALDGVWFLVRCVDAPEPPHPQRMRVLLDRGPFTLDGERELLRRHRVDVLVTKDSGGAATAPKLRAAREAGIPVVRVARPPAPAGVDTVTTTQDAAAWLLGRCGGGGDGDG